MRCAPLLAALAAALALSSCGGLPRAGQGAGATPAPAAYKPQTRSFTLTTVPYLVKEMQGMLPYLKQDFAKGGLLEGKEVYGFIPGTLAVYAGDRLDLTIVNPEDDPHTFTIGDLAVNVNLPPRSSTRASFTASRPGAFTFVCAQPDHVPYMWGQLLVLPDSAAG